MRLPMHAYDCNVEQIRPKGVLDICSLQTACITMTHLYELCLFIEADETHDDRLMEFADEEGFGLTMTCRDRLCVAYTAIQLRRKRL